MDIVSRARRFFESNGRDIDRARFAFHFDHLPLEEMLSVLARYQNEDGGFGHALEVDIRAPDSNPFATELALFACLQADVPRENPLLQRAVAYLEISQDDEGGWRFSDAIYQHELAPWFQGWEWPSLNPTCTIAGLLKELGLGSPQLHNRVEDLFERLKRPEELAIGEYYSVRPYAYYFLPEWEHPERDLYLSGVLWWLIRQHAMDGDHDAGHFFAYVRSPDSYTGERVPAHILSHWLTRLEAEQQEDGGWPTPYNPEWRGPVTVDNLLVLRSFGRL